jgi:hypothetical protein
MRVKWAWQRNAISKQRAEMSPQVSHRLARTVAAQMNPSLQSLSLVQKVMTDKQKMH